MYRKQRGQSLFEVIIAIGIIALIVVGIVAVSTTSVRNSSFSRNKALANKYALEAMEWVRKRRDANWGNTFAKGGPNASMPAYWCLDFLPELNWVGSGKNRGCDSTSSDDYLKDSSGAATIFLRELIMYKQDADGDPTTEDSFNATVLVYWNDAQGTHEIRTVSDFTDWRLSP
jgi:type II secretory pathway pseudopilin PulG